MKKVTFSVLAISLCSPVAAQDLTTETFFADLSPYVYGQLAAPFDPNPEYTFVPGDSTTEVPLSGGAVAIGVGATLQKFGTVNIGFEADLSAGNIESDRVMVDTTPCVLPGATEGCTAQVGTVATGRATIGYELSDFVPYLTAGVAAAEVSGSADTLACSAATCEFDELLTGWTAGIGMTYAYTDQLSLKVDALYFDLGEPEFTSAGVTGEFAFSELRLGIAYTF